MFSGLTENVGAELLEHRSCFCTGGGSFRIHQVAGLTGDDSCAHGPGDIFDGRLALNRMNDVDIQGASVDILLPVIDLAVRSFAVGVHIILVKTIEVIPLDRETKYAFDIAAGLLDVLL